MRWRLASLVWGLLGLGRFLRGTDGESGADGQMSRPPEVRAWTGVSPLGDRHVLTYIVDTFVIGAAVSIALRNLSPSARVLFEVESAGAG